MAIEIPTAVVEPAAGAAPAPGSASAPTRYEVTQLLRMPKRELDELFRSRPAGEIPDGIADGTAVVFSGTFLAKLFAWFARVFLWQGKVFDRSGGALINRITVLGIKGIRAKVYPGNSWMDQKECTVIDYSKTSLIAKMVRDEIRQVGDGVYLGPVFLWGKRTIYFALDFKKKRASGR